MHTNTRTVFLPRKLKRVVNVSIRSVRGLSRVGINFSSRIHPGLRRFNAGYLHVNHHLRRNFMMASRPNICFVPTLVSR